MDDGGESDDDWSLDSGGAKEVGASEVGNVVGYFEESFGTGSSCMDYTLRDTLACEGCDFFNELVVFQKNGTSFSDRHDGGVVPYWCTGVGGAKGRVVRT